MKKIEFFGYVVSENFNLKNLEGSDSYGNESYLIFKFKDEKFWSQKVKVTVEFIENS